MSSFDDALLQTLQVGWRPHLVTLENIRDPSAFREQLVRLRQVLAG
jgi:hypothetical protein